jgi:hypothetical protein
MGNMRSDLERAVNDSHIQAKLDETLAIITGLDPHDHGATGRDRYPVDQCVYHYTTAEGLIGILQNRCLWGSHYKYLNDSSELDYGIRLVAKRIADRIKTLEGVARTTTETLFKDVTETTFKDCDVFIACMCSRENLLSQWRGYSAGGGYSVALKPRRLKGQYRAVIPPPNDWGIGLAKVIYDPEEQHRMITEVESPTFAYLGMLIDRLVEMVQTTELDRVRKWLAKWSVHAVSAMMFALFQMAYRFKDPCFKEEQEWRFIHLREKDDQEIVKYRTAQGLIIPYIEFPIHSADPDEFCFEIDSITCGPHVRGDLAERSVRMLLKKHGFDNVAVRSSTIPIRRT